jgi:hypothetical protein
MAVPITEEINNMKTLRAIVTVAMLACSVVGANATSAVPLTPDAGSTTTTVTATVPEQCEVSLPATCAFTVSDITQAYTTDVSVGASYIVLNDGNSLRLSMQAAAPSFTGPVVGHHSYAASAISWPADTWSNGTGAAGTLSDVSAVPVVLSSANAGTMGDATLPITLASDVLVDRAGNHTLTVNWIVESVTP